MTLLDPGVDPSGAEARRLLQRELLDPVYHDTNLVERLLAWLGRQVDRGVGAAAQAPALTTLAAMLVFVTLGLAGAWLLSRLRRSGTGRVEQRPVLDDETLSALELRVRAQQELEQGRYAEALVDAYRAVAVHQVEQGRLVDAPGATAHEVADVLAAAHPALRERLVESARLFDLVRYGDRPATREQAATMLGLDDELAIRR
ncbi:DUF4129 domain-containing protein [Nocardioides sp.]|uniref:DUF4129 domain-containing protein n=1 Tax=Nocardioides sp. TaxID=35761 RepID=UPI003566D032